MGLILRNRFFCAWRWLLLACLSWALLACQPLQEPAPPSEFLQLDGSRISTEALQGKVWLLNFWATSCTTCVAEMPDLARIHQRYQAQGYDTIALAMQYDPPAFVQNFAQQNALPFRVALDHKGELAQSWGGIKATPTSFLIDKKGRIVKRLVGPPNFQQLQADIEKLLAQ